MTDYGHVLTRFHARPTLTAWRWRGCCPLHGRRTRNLNLSLWIGRDGRLMLGCWARCPKLEVLRAVGLGMRDLFPDSQDKSSYTPWDRPKPKPVAYYEYHDEEGRLLYHVVRTDPKGFYQERFYGDEFRPGLGDVRRVLYRLPMLCAHPKRPVLLFEGEGKADRVNALGLPVVATSAVGGTGMGWRAEYAPSLIGRRLVVFPDNDLTGREHAWTVAGSMLVAGAESIRIVYLPVAGDGDDIVNWLDAGNGPAELVEVIRSAPEWRPVKVT